MDIVVLDIVMDINGIEVAKRIRERNNYIKIVFFSNYEHFAVQGYTVKATRYLLKTDSEKKLVEAVKELLEDCQKERGKVFLEQIRKQSYTDSVFRCNVCGNVYEKNKASYSDWGIY